MSAIFLKQKLKPYSIIAITISFTGIILISLRGNFNLFEITEPLGVILAVDSSVIWALFWIFNVKDKRDEVVKLFLSFCFSTFFIFSVTLTFSDFTITNYNGLWAAIYVGAFEMAFPFVLWLIALKGVKSNEKLSNLVFISPFLSLIWIYIILDESVFYTTIIGLVLIIIGIFVQQFSKKLSK